MKVCFECGSVNNIRNHHVVPKSLGGTKTISLCLDCHGKVHNMDFTKIEHLRKLGVEKAKANGVFKGRAYGSVETRQKFLSKPNNRAMVALLNRGWSIRKICRELECSPNTVLKVKKIKGIT